MEEKLSRKSLNLSVIIPAYNEERRIGRSIELIDDYLNRAGYGYEAIVVDDGSVDGTVSVVEGLTSRYRGIHLLKNRVNHGKGYSIRRGIKHSNGNLILMSDADLSTPIEELEKLLDPIIAGSCQVAIGSRALPGSDVQVAPTLVQRGHGEDIQSIRSGSGLPGIKDTQCGFKCFTGQAAKAIFCHQRLDGFSFDVEALFIAKKLGYRITQVPVVWINSPDSKVHIIKAPVQMFIDLWKIRRLHGVEGRNLSKVPKRVSTVEV